MSRSLSCLILLCTAACTGASQGDTTAQGQAAYQDAQTNPDGTSHTMSRPSSQPKSDPMYVQVDVQGTGDFSVSNPDCQLDQASGTFQGVYDGDGKITSDGGYVAGMSSSEATFTTPSGCTLPDLSIGAVTGLSVRGELSATTRNCSAYCAAKARSVAESDCSGSMDEASCRSSEQTSYEASCNTACSDPSTRTIVAETDLGTSALSNLDLSSLAGTALGTIQVDLTFDHLEDGNGRTVPEQ